MGWQVSDAPEQYVQSMGGHIVGLEMTLLEDPFGKWKCSRNKADVDAIGVVRGLRADGHEQMANLVRHAVGLTERAVAERQPTRGWGVFSVLGMIGVTLVGVHVLWAMRTKG